MLFRSTILAAMASLLAASPAAALTLDFEEAGLGHGSVVTSSQGVTIVTTNLGGGPDIGVSFDTNLTATRDPDLQRISPGFAEGAKGWSGGNLAPDTDLGNILIIQENATDCDTGTCSQPDDEGTRPAGHFDLDFSALGSFNRFAFDLIDVDDATMEMGSVEFFLGAISQGIFDFSSFLSDPAVFYGDNSANTIDESQFGTASFDRVRIALGGSGGVDNISVNAVPEPSAGLLLTTGLVIVAGARRRRRAAAGDIARGVH